MKISAVIPVRKGSERVPNKNLKAFCDTTLLDLKIQTLLNVPEIDEIVVNTDSDEAIQKVIDYNNPKVKYHKREAYYASAQCSASDFLKHLGETTDTDIFVYAPCTNPLVSAQTYSNCINEFLGNSDIDSLTTANYVKDFLWENNKAINYDSLKAPRSQDLPDIISLNFACSVMTKDNLLKYSYVVGQKPKFIITDEIESVDIDTPTDFFIAEQLYKLKHNML